MNKVKYFLTYRYAEIIHDLTVEFIKEGGYTESLAKRRIEFRKNS